MSIRITLTAACLVLPLPGLLIIPVLLAGATAIGAETTNSASASADYELRVNDRPILQRGFLPGSSPRSIAVGLPGGVSYCFDAESCRLRYAWSGGFLNMKPTWDGRGAAPPELGGEKFFTAPATMPLRVGDRTSVPTTKFLGYGLVDGLPEFRFTLDGVAVRERIERAPDGGLQCTFELRESEKEVWFYVPTGVRVSAAGRELDNDAESWTKIPRDARFQAWIPGPANAKPVNTATGTSSDR